MQAPQDPLHEPKLCDISGQIAIDTLISRNYSQMTGQQQADVRLYLYSVAKGETGKDWSKHAQQSVASTIL